MMAMVNAFPLAVLGDDVWEIQSTSGEELSAVMASVRVEGWASEGMNLEQENEGESFISQTAVG